MPTSRRRPHLLRGLVGLHASFTVSDETVREAGELARELGTVVHVHVAEDLADVDDARRRGAAGPLERLLSLGALSARFDPRSWRSSDRRPSAYRRVPLAAGSCTIRAPTRAIASAMRAICRPRPEWRWAPMAGMPTWRSRRRRCCGSPRSMAILVSAAGWRRAMAWWRSVLAASPKRWRPAPLATRGAGRRQGSPRRGGRPAGGEGRDPGEQATSMQSLLPRSTRRLVYGPVWSKFERRECARRGSIEAARGLNSPARD